MLCYARANYTFKDGLELSECLCNVFWGQMTPIASLKMELVLEHRCLIAVNDQYICYGLKQGMIRVINQSSGDRILLKGHTSCPTTLR